MGARRTRPDRLARCGNALDIGRPPERDLRTILDAIPYVNRTGIPWRYLPRTICPGRPPTPTPLEFVGSTGMIMVV